MATDAGFDSRAALMLAADHARDGAEELRAIGGSERTLDLVREVEQRLRSMSESVDEGFGEHADPR